MSSCVCVTKMSSFFLLQKKNGILLLQNRCSSVPGVKFKKSIRWTTCELIATILYAIPMNTTYVLYFLLLSNSNNILIPPSSSWHYLTISIAHTSYITPKGSNTIAINKTWKTDIVQGCPSEIQYPYTFETKNISISRSRSRTC